MQGFNLNFYNYFALFYVFNHNFTIFAQNWIAMALKIKELCKEKHITMAEIAAKIGINPITLSQSLSGNPTLSRLQEVADILGVEVPDLFERKRQKKEVFGCLYVDKKPVIIKSIDDINIFLDQMKNS